MADILDYGDPSDGMDGSRESNTFSGGGVQGSLTEDSAYGRDGDDAGMSSWQDSYDKMESTNSNDRPLLDDAMEAELRAWEDSYDGMPDEYDTRREAKLTELMASRKQGGARFYALPRDEAVRAGAQRGVTSTEQTAADLADVDLMGSAAAADEGVTPPQMPQTIGQGLDVRYSALHMQGLPITQCSTSRLFAYVTHFGAQPLGLEWVNDSSCNIVFSDANAARIAIEYLCPPLDSSSESIVPLPTDRELDEAAQIKRMHDAGEDAERLESHEWPQNFMQAVLTPRKAQRFPAKLYNAPERDAALELVKENENASKSALPDDVPEIYREMELEDRRRQLSHPKQKGLASLRSNLWLRWTVESLDVKGSDAARRSKWYREHGRDAGRDVVTKMLSVGGAQERKELLPNERGSRGKREREGKDDSSAAMDKLDRELEQWRENGEQQQTFEDRWDDRLPSSRGGQRGSRSGYHRERMDIAEDDVDMETNYANGHHRSRSASPAARRHRDRIGGPDSGDQVRARGRGRTRAPSAWDNSEDTYSSHDRMQADAVERRGRRGGRRRGRNIVGGTLENRLHVPAGEARSIKGASLASRFGPPRQSGLEDRLL